MTSILRISPFLLMLSLPLQAYAQGTPPDGATAPPDAPPDTSDTNEDESDSPNSVAPDDQPTVVPDDGVMPGHDTADTAIEPAAATIPREESAYAEPIAPIAESASAPGALTYTASFFTRYELRDEFDTLGASKGRFLEGDAIVYRARLGLTLPAIDIGNGRTVSVQFTPQASGFFGEGTVTDSALGVHEGYVRTKGQRLGVDVGRFVMNYGDALIIGDLDWHETARSFQGVRASWKQRPDSYQVDAFVTQLAEGRVVGTLEPTGAGDQYLSGVHAMLGPLMSKTMALDVYLLGLTWPETNVPVDPNDPSAGTMTRQMATTVTLGTRVKNKVGAFDYRLEAGLQFGTALAAPGADSPSALAYHADLEIGASASQGRLRASVEGLVASGNDPETADKAEGWNQLFPTAHKWLGLSDFFGARTNVASGAAHLSYKLGHEMTAKLDGHVFTRLQPAAVGGETGYAGMEVDAQLVHALGKGLTLRGLYGLFAPNADIYGADTAAHYVEIELRYDIK